MCTKENAVNVKRVQDSLEISSDQEVLSWKDQLIYSLMWLKESVSFEPIESANVKVTPVNEPLPQLVKHYATIDSLFFEVNHFNSSVQRGETAMLELITKDHKGNYYPRGGCEVTVQLQSSMEEMIPAKVIDNKDGTYMVCCSTQHVGRLKLSVFVNGHEIKQSPFEIVVKKTPRVIAIHNDNFGQLWGIACSNSGTCAVTDWLHNCVYVLDSQKKPIKRFGSQGIRNGQFNYPCGVAFDDHNDLYVTDSHNHRVQKFNICGKYLLQFGGDGTREGQLKCPTGITTHQDRIYVADRENCRISVFNNDGKFCCVIGQQQLSQQFDVTVNIFGEILVADWGHHCVYIFAVDGEYKRNMILFKDSSSLQPDGPCCIVTDSNGFILLAEISNHCITIFDRAGNYISCFGCKGSNVDQFIFPLGIAVGPDNNICVSDTGNKRVQIFPAFS